jgi:hypothetical protein
MAELEEVVVGGDRVVGRGKGLEGGAAVAVEVDVGVDAARAAAAGEPCLTDLLRDTAGRGDRVELLEALCARPG